MIEISLVLIPNCINKVVKGTCNDAIARKEWKFRLTRQLYEQGCDRRDLINSDLAPMHKYYYCDHLRADMKRRFYISWGRGSANGGSPRIKKRQDSGVFTASGEPPHKKRQDSATATQRTGGFLPFVCVKTRQPRPYTINL